LKSSNYQDQVLNPLTQEPKLNIYLYYTGAIESCILCLIITRIPMLSQHPPLLRLSPSPNLHKTSLSIFPLTAKLANTIHPALKLFENASLTTICFPISLILYTDSTFAAASPPVKASVRLLLRPAQRSSDLCVQIEDWGMTPSITAARPDARLRINQ
jgi:hypothetical protein